MTAIDPEANRLYQELFRNFETSVITNFNNALDLKGEEKPAFLDKLTMLMTRHPVFRLFSQMVFSDFVSEIENEPEILLFLQEITTKSFIGFNAGSYGPLVDINSLIVQFVINPICLSAPKFTYENANFNDLNPTMVSLALDRKYALMCFENLPLSAVFVVIQSSIFKTNKKVK